MARKFVRAVTLVVDDNTAYTAEVFKTSTRGAHGAMYHTEFRKGTGKPFDHEDASHRSDAEAIRTAAARLQQIRRKGNPDQGNARYSVHVDMGEHVHSGARKDNPETGPAGSEIATQSEIGAFIDELDRITLYATPLGKTRGPKSWENGEVFQAVNPPHWEGSPFFRSSDAERIYGMGYRKIVVMSGAGSFDIELVMQ